MREGLRGLIGLLCAVAATAAGCSSCDDGPAVPFKRPAGGGAPAPTGAEASAAAATAAGGPTTGSSYPAGTSGLQLGGRLLTLKSGEIRAALQVEVGPDRPPELLLVTQTADGGPVELQVARPDATGWATPETAVELLAAAGPCRLNTASFERLSATYALASAEVTCTQTAAAAVDAPPPTPAATPAAPPSSGTPPVDLPEPPGSSPPPPPAAPTPASATPAAPAPASASSAERQLWVVALDAPPRIVQSFATLAPVTGSPSVSAAVKSRDIDGDGHDDLLLGLSVHTKSADTVVNVEFFDRAGGLSQEPSQPEKTLLALADQAKTERRGKPGNARGMAQLVLGLHRVLCRESGAALVRVNDELGLACGASLAAGRAASVEAALLASDGHLLEALERYETLRAPAYRLTDNDWERARAALNSRVEAQGFTFRQIALLTPPAGPSARGSALAFVDEQHLLVRGVPAQSYDLTTGQLAPIGMPGDTLITDPSGKLAISAIVRSCEGYHLAIVPAARITLGVVAGKPVAEPLLAPAPAPAGAHCPELSAEQHRDTGGYRVISWTARGVLLVRGHALSLLALDENAHATAPAQPLGDAAALPAQTHSGELTADGRYHALVTPLGLAIRDRKAGGAARLFALPQGSQPVTDIALSPSATRVALLRGGQLLLGQQSTSAPAQAPVSPP